MRDEIIPLIEERFAVASEHRCIAGHSLGSLFGLYAFFHDEPLFSRALLSAPSIWYDDRRILGLEEAFAKDHRRLDGKLFLCVGEDDSPSMSSDLALLEEVLAKRPYEGLEIKSQRFPGRGHLDVLPDAFEAGLAFLARK